MADSLHVNFMTEALSACSQVTRSVMPNPSVGAIITRNGAIIGRGYHKEFGGPHAEVHAINSVPDYELLRESTLYVTLEPCCHTGKTPPCTDAILQAQIPRVVIGCRDPNPRVAGGGIRALRAAGVEVIEDILHDECVLANHRFITSQKYRRPYIILKWAQTYDGFIAPVDRSPIRITCPLSLDLLHYWRGNEMAIAVGTTTACADNPHLTVRHTNLYNQSELPPLQPTRVVIGNGTHIPLHSHVYQPTAQTIRFIPNYSPQTTSESFITTCRYHPEEPILPQMCQQLTSLGILSVIVEGGAVTLQYFLDTDLWDEIRMFTAPMLLKSGISAPTAPVPAIITTTCGADTLYSFAHPDLALRLGVQNSKITNFLRSSSALARLPMTLHEPPV